MMMVVMMMMMMMIFGTFQAGLARKYQ